METVVKSCSKSEEKKDSCTADALILPGQILQASDKEKDTFRIVTYALKEAANAFFADEFDVACMKYKIAFNLLLTENWKVEYYKKDIVQYMLCVCLIECGSARDLRDALFLLHTLETSIGNAFGPVYCALANLHIKHYRFDFALKAVHKGFSFLNKNTEVLQYCIPGTNHVIRETTAEGLLNTLMTLKEKCSNWHPPEAVCNLADCNSGNEFYPANKNIYFGDPMFDGMVTVTCNNETHPCVLKYHQTCWNHVKMKMSIRKLTDEEAIGRRCVTPNCKNFSKFSIINKIEIYGPDGTIQTFPSFPTPKFSATFLTKEPSPKGAIKKQCKYLEPEKKLRRPHAVEVPLLQQCTNQIPDKPSEKELKKDVNDNDTVFKSYESAKVLETSVESKENKDPLENSDQINNVNCITKDKENDETENKSDSKEEMPNQTVQSKESNNNDMDTSPKCDTKNNSVEQSMQSDICAQGNPFLCYDTSNYAQYKTGYELNTEASENDSKFVNVNSTNSCEKPAEEAENYSNNDELIHFDHIIKTLISFKQSNGIDMKTVKDEAIPAKSVTDSLLKKAHRNSVTNFDELKMLMKEVTISKEPRRKIPQNNVKNGCLFTETINIESNTEPLLEEKNSVTNSYEQKHESLCKKLEACEKELITKDEEIQALQAKYFSLKQSMLQKHLYYQFTANKCFLERNIELCTVALGVINQINDVFKRLLGYSVISDNVEWLKAVSSFHEISAKNWEQYTLLKSLLEVREKVEEMDDIILNLPNIPPPPKRKLKDALQQALSTYESCVMQIIQQLTAQAMKAPTLQCPVPKNSWCIPPAVPHHAHASNYSSHFYNTRKIGESVVNYHKPVMPTMKAIQQVNVDNKIQATDAHAAQTANESPTKNVDQSPEKEKNVEECKTIEAQDGAKSSLGNNDQSSTNQCENTECSENIEVDSEALQEEQPLEKEYESLIDIPDESALDNDKCDIPSDICDIQQDVEAMIRDEINNGATQHTVQYVPLNFDELMQILRTKFPGIMELDLLESILTVKRMFNNSLSGLMLQTIIKEVGKCILSRQGKYLCMYNTSTESNTHNVTSTKNEKQKPTTSSTKGKAQKSIAGPSLRVAKKLNSKGNAAVKSLEKQLTAKSSSKGKETNGSTVKSKEPAKCPWNTQPTRNETWTKGSMETECIICMENIYEKGKGVYTLECKHTFHKLCVKEWFEHNQSCPTCRIHCTIDEEYPPLPS